jgi:hypothetical protein
MQRTVLYGVSFTTSRSLLGSLGRPVFLVEVVEFHYAEERRGQKVTEGMNETYYH